MYSYDSLGQLVEATVGDRIYSYVYDNGGNITSKTVHGEETFYAYNHSEWKDLLTSYNGQTITYDTIGNPLTYYNGSTFTWSDGRRLTNVSNGTNTYSYQYDESGYRVSKTVNGNTTVYHWLDGRLQAEETNTYLLVYHYDENGSRVGFTYKTNASEANYYYVYNLQGDVIGIIDNTGTTVVQYTYDPWGKVLSVTGTEANTIGALNPIRYRGYYYDNETSFYYCISRYYDPEIGRFINPDKYVSTGQGVLSYNMFTYCLSNPVNLQDEDGNSAELVMGWTSGMSWLALVDTALPFGDIIYVGGTIVLGVVAIASSAKKNSTGTSSNSSDVSGSSTPNGDDDDDDDYAYYDDDSNFGGRQKIGKSKGKTPGNNQAQNKQFRDATKGLPPAKQRIIHDKITGKGLGYYEIKSAIKDLFVVVFSVFAFEENAVSETEVE